MSEPVTQNISKDILRQIQQFDACTISNAIETFQVRTRNEGFVNGSIRCVVPEFEPKLGYAVTARIRTSSTPIAGHCYFDRMDWWSYVETVPAPRFVVVEDVDHIPGVGALLGEIHANICTALDCVAFLTNGAVRDLPGVKKTGLQLFAGSIAVSHAYAHIVDYGEPIEVGGLQIKSGNLLQGDRHGVLSIPLELASELPLVARELLSSEKELIEFCQSDTFSLDELTERIQRVSGRLND